MAAQFLKEHVHRLTENNLEIKSLQTSHQCSTREQDEEETDHVERAWKRPHLLRPEVCSPNIIRSTQDRVLMSLLKQINKQMAEPRIIIVLDVYHHIIIFYNVLLLSHIQG